MKKEKSVPMCVLIVIAISSLTGCAGSPKTEVNDSGLLVGAGKEEVVFPVGYFPLVDGRDTYSYQADALSASVVLIYQGTSKYAIVSLEHVNPDAVQLNDYKLLIEAETGVAVENQIFHNPHVLSTPHGTIDANGYDAYAVALKNASKKAASSLRPATFGYANGYTDVAVNRTTWTPAGWWQASNFAGVTSHDLPVLRFNDTAGKPIAIIYQVNCAAGVLENALLADGTKPVSADIAGASERYIEKRFGGNVVAIYAAGATGNQWQVMRAVPGSIGADGAVSQTQTVLGAEFGLHLVDIIGRRLGEQVYSAAATIKSAGVDSLVYKTAQFEFAGVTVTLDGSARVNGATNVINYARNGSFLSDVTAFRIGDVGIVAVKPELNIETVNSIVQASPYAHTMVLGWCSVNMLEAQILNRAICLI